MSLECETFTPNPGSKMSVAFAPSMAMAAAAVMLRLAALKAMTLFAGKAKVGACDAMAEVNEACTDSANGVGGLPGLKPAASAGEISTKWGKRMLPFFVSLLSPQLRLPA